MNAKDEDTIADLLIQWEENLESGKELTPDELCLECEHLEQELARRIKALKEIAWLDKPKFKAIDSESSNFVSQVLADRYRLDELHAEGGHATVWKGFDLKLERIVAIKNPKRTRFHLPDSLKEARFLAQFRHPNILPVIDVVDDGDLRLIISDWIEGGSLDKVQLPLPVDQAVAITQQLAEALHFAHSKGILHRDIKPANILLSENGMPLLADFGIAKYFTAEIGDHAQASNTAPNTAFDLATTQGGTLRYSSPEQVTFQPLDARSDVYSLGMVLYQLLSGELPFHSDNPADVQQEIIRGVHVDLGSLPQSLTKICRKALAVEPSNRYASTEEFAKALRDLSQRRSWNLGMLSAVTLALGSLLGISIWLTGIMPKETTPALDKKWIEKVASLSASEQVTEVSAKLKELNPGFDGEVITKEENGDVILWDMRTDHVTNITPLAVFKKLRSVNLGGTYNWKHNGQLVDLSPLRGLPIEECDIRSTLVEDLKPLENAPLTYLDMETTKVTDLSPLRNAKLTRLDIHNTMISDLTPIQGMAITYLHMANTQVKDLSALSGMPLEDLRCQYCGIKDMKVLQGKPLHTLEIHGNPITDLSPLANSKIQYLNIYKTSITDWSALKTMRELKMIGFDFDKQRDSEILKAIPMLEQINERSSADFWRMVEQEDSKK